MVASVVENMISVTLAWTGPEWMGPLAVAYNFPDPPFLAVLVQKKRKSLNKNKVVLSAHTPQILRKESKNAPQNKANRERKNNENPPPPKARKQGSEFH